MKKIPSLFVRDQVSHFVTSEITPGCDWVSVGEGVATRKFDGTCCLIRNGHLYKRYDAKKGKAPPLLFEPAQPEPDPITGHWPGWVPVDDNDKYYQEALKLGMATTGRMVGGQAEMVPFEDGTYELIGPKVQSNPEKSLIHILVKHGTFPLLDAPRSYSELKTYLLAREMEGIVWHHPDGRMAKIKRKDFAP